MKTWSMFLSDKSTAADIRNLSDFNKVKPRLLCEHRLPGKNYKHCGAGTYIIVTWTGLTLRPGLHLVIKCIWGDWITSGQREIQVQASSKMPRDPNTQTTCQGGLGCIWPHIFCSVNANASWCAPINASRLALFCKSQMTLQLEQPIHEY